MILSRTSSTTHNLIERSAVNDKLKLWLYGAALFALSFGLFFALLSSTAGFVGNDDYYHARISAEIIEQGQMAVDFVWLPQTILSPEQFTDHHLLYHLYLAPWVYYGGISGAKIAQAGVAAGVIVALWALLRSVQVRFATLWAFALLGMSIPFIDRLLMIRTQGASLLLLLLALYVLFTRRYRWIVPLAFAYTWLYDGFVLLPVFTAAYAGATWMTERRIAWQPIVYSLAGIALGLVINPYFPQNIQFILDHLGAKVAFEGGISVGNEWYPYSTGVLLENSTGALLALAAGIVAVRKRDRIEMTALFVTLITLGMVFKSRRFIEYFPAFALLLCAVTWGRGQALDWLPHVALRRLALAAGIGISVLLGANTLRAAYGEIINSTDVTYMAGASDWLRRNAEPGAMVFQTDWDDFPYLFFHNTHNTYLVGLDPTYLEIANPQLWTRWVAITRGQVAQPSSVIVDEFQAVYVVSDVYHDDFLEQVRHDASMQLVYRDAYSYVWRIVQQ
ncbi:MAG: hypothetical protein U0694_05905 [Anaerolineae bacterium]